MQRPALTAENVSTLLTEHKTKIGERICYAFGAYFSTRIKTTHQELDVPTIMRAGRRLVSDIDIIASIKDKQIKLLSEAYAFKFCDLATKGDLQFVATERLIILTSRSVYILWRDSTGPVKFHRENRTGELGWDATSEKERFVFDAQFPFHVVGGTDAQHTLP